MIKTIVFDVSGVLTEDDPKLVTESLSSRFGVDYDLIWNVVFIKNYKLARVGKLNAHELFEKSKQELGIDISYNDFVEEYLKGYKIREFMIDFIKKLKTRYKLVILSNQTEINTNHLYPIFNDLFDKIIFSNEVGLCKPYDLKFYDLIFKGEDIVPEECVFIDDKENCLPPAREKGMRTILFNDLDQLKKELVLLGVNI